MFSLFSLFEVEPVERCNFDNIIKFLMSQQELLKDRRAIEFNSINNDDYENLDAKIERLAKLQSIINKNGYFLCLLAAVNHSSRKIAAVEFVSPADANNVHDKQKAIDDFCKNFFDIETKLKSNLERNNNIIFIINLLECVIGLTAFSSLIILGFITAMSGVHNALVAALLLVFYGMFGLIWIVFMALNYQSPEPEYLVKYHNLLAADDRVIKELLSEGNFNSLKIKIGELSNGRDNLLDVLIDKEPTISHQTENTETITVQATSEETDQEDFDFPPSLLA